MKIDKTLVVHILAILLILPSSAYAESGDKLTSSALMIFFSISTAAFLFFSYKVSWWFPLILTPLSLFFLLRIEDIVRENHFTQNATDTDGTYTALLVLSVLTIVVCHGLGIKRGLRLRDEKN